MVSVSHTGCILYRLLPLKLMLNILTFLCDVLCIPTPSESYRNVVNVLYFHQGAAWIQHFPGWLRTCISCTEWNYSKPEILSPFITVNKSTYKPVVLVINIWQTFLNPDFWGAQFLLRMLFGCVKVFNYLVIFNICIASLYFVCIYF